MGMHVIDKLRVAGVMKNKHRGVSRGVYFSLLWARSLSYCSFVLHKDPPSLVTLKSGKVWLLGREAWRGKCNERDLPNTVKCSCHVKKAKYRHDVSLSL